MPMHRCESVNLPIPNKDSSPRMRVGNILLEVGNILLEAHDDSHVCARTMSPMKHENVHGDFLFMFGVIIHLFDRPLRNGLPVCVQSV